MQVNVVGRTWEGFEATYSYSIGGESVPDAATVRRLAGDFQAVTDYQIIGTEYHYQAIPGGTRTVTDTVVLRDWDNAESEAAFAMAGGD